jgi:hypothetical protein
MAQQTHNTLLTKYKPCLHKEISKPGVGPHTCLQEVACCQLASLASKVWPCCSTLSALSASALSLHCHQPQGGKLLPHLLHLLLEHVKVTLVVIVELAVNEAIIIELLDIKLSYNKPA